MTTSAHTATTHAEQIEGRLELLADDQLTGYAVADKHGELVGMVEINPCGCCWDAREVTLGLAVVGSGNDLDGALASLAAVLGVDVEELELVAF